MGHRPNVFALWHFLDAVWAENFISCFSFDMTSDFANFIEAKRTRVRQNKLLKTKEKHHLIIFVCRYGKLFCCRGIETTLFQVNNRLDRRWFTWYLKEVAGINSSELWKLSKHMLLDLLFNLTDFPDSRSAETTPKLGPV